MADQGIRVQIVAVPAFHPLWSEGTALRFFEKHQFRLMVHNAYGATMWVMGGENLGHVDPVIEDLMSGAPTRDGEPGLAESFFRLLAENASRATSVVVGVTRLLPPVTLAETLALGLDAAYELSAKRRTSFAQACERVSRFFSFSLLYVSNPAAELQQHARLAGLISGNAVDEATSRIMDDYTTLLASERQELIEEGPFEEARGVELQAGASAGFWCDALNRIGCLEAAINPRRLEPPESIKDFYGMESFLEEAALRKLRKLGAVRSLLRSGAARERVDEGEETPADLLAKSLRTSERLRSFIIEPTAENAPGFARDKVMLAEMVGIAV